MSGSVDIADILVVVDKGNQFNLSLQPPDEYGISINSGDTYVVNIDLPSTVVANPTDMYYRVSDFALLAATASFFGGASASVDWPNITNKPSGIVSSSTQINYTNISNIPSGIISSSTQINQLSNVSASFATTSSYALNAGAGAGFPFSGSAVITGSLLVSGGNIVGTLVGTSSLAQTVIGGKSRYVPLWTGSLENQLTSSIIYQTNTGIFVGYESNPHFHSAEGETLAVHSGETGVKNVIYAHGTIDNDYRINVRNISSGPSASTNFKATSDVGNDVGGYVEMGINSSTYSRTDQIGGPLDAYLFTTGSDLLIGTLSPDKRIILFTGPGDADNNARVYIDSSGSVAINTSVPTIGNPEALLVAGITDSYNLITAQANVDNYSQINIKNINGGNSSSADIVATANNGTETSYYINMGINSDQYGLVDTVGGPSDAYLYSTGRMLHIGNATPGEHIMFFAGGSDSEANAKLILESNNHHILSGSLNVTGSVNVLDGVINNLTASYAITASYISGAITTWDDLLNKPANLVSSSQQAASWTVLSASFANTASTATSASYAPTKAGIVSASSQINYTQLQNIPTGIVSSSAQVTSLLPIGTVSSSLQINTGSFSGSFTGTLIGTSSWSTSASFAVTASHVLSTGLPSGIISSSTQIISSLPSGIVSSSTQINTGSFSGSFRGNVIGTSSVATSASFAITASSATSITFIPATASFATSASYAPTNAGIISSSTQVNYNQLQNLPTTIATASYVEYNNVINKPTLISSSTQVNYNQLQNIPSGIVSSSTQINTGSFFGSFIGTSSWATNAITATSVLGGATGYVPLWSGTTTLTSSLLYQTGSSILLGATVQHTPEAPDRFGVFAGITDSYNLISAHGEINNYLQLNVKNFSSESNASSDFVATADTGTELGGFINLGINSSNYNIPNAIGNALDAYLYSTGSNLLIGNTTPGKKVILFNGEGTALDNARVYIDSIGTVSINTGSATPGNPEALLVKAIAFSYNMITAQADINNYAQVNIINKNSGNFASSDFVATANNGNEDQYYIAMGINSENFTGDVGLANDAYLYTTGSNLLVGNIAPDKKLILFAGDVDANASAKFIIDPNNQHQITGSLTITGSITVDANVINALTASNAVSSSHAISASYAPLILPPNIVSSSVQINTGSFSGSFVGTLVGTSSWASNAITSSFATTASAATSITFTPSTASFAITASYAPTILPTGTVSSSTQVNYTQLQNIPNGIVSSSTQVTSLLPAGVVSSSAQINTGSFSGSFVGDGSQLTGVVASGVAVTIADNSVIQGSAGQLDFGNLITATVAANTASINVSLPSGLVSASSQINTGSFSGSFTGNVIGTSSWASNAITASYALNASSGGGSSAVTIDTYTFDADGSTVNYVVSQSYDAASLFVMVNGLGYTNPTDYTISSNTITFTTAPVSSSYIVVRALTNVSSNATGSFSGSFFGIIQSASYATTASFAISASWAPGGAGTNNWNDLTNIPSGLVSSSTQASTWSVASSSVAVSASYAPTILPVGVISSSTQVNYTQLQNIPSGIVSSSTQVTALLPNGVVSSSVQINTGSFSGSFKGLFVGDGSQLTGVVASGVGITISDDGVTQGNAGEINFGNFITATVASSTASINVALPNGTVSSSNQINTGSFSGSFTGNLNGTSSFSTNALTSSYFSGSVKITGLAEFPAGIKVEGPSSITGSLTFSSGGITGSMFGTSSWASLAISSSFATSSSFAVSSSRAVTSSFAISASWAPAGGGSVTSITAGNGLTGGTITSTGTITVDTGSTHFLDGVKKELNTEGVVSSSIQINTGSFSGSFTGNLIGTASLATTASFAVTASYFSGSVEFVSGLDITGSLIVTGSQLITGSLNVTQGITGSFLGTSSWASNSVSSSFATTARLLDQTSSAVFATTGSNTFVGNQIITGSVILSSSLPTELRVIGDAEITGSLRMLGGTTSSLFGTSSWALNALTSSYFSGSLEFSNGLVVTGSVTASVGFTGSFIGTLLGTGSWANSASLATSASFATTASFATSASWAPTVAGTMVPIQDEGAVVVSTPVALNFIGAGVTVTNTSNTASITISGGSGGISAKIVSASYTFGASDEFIFTTGSFTVNVPSAIGIIGRQYQIKNISSGVIFITGSSMIDDYSDITITEKNTSLGLISNGISWSIF